jgi:hypothetical protein
MLDSVTGCSFPSAFALTSGARRCIPPGSSWLARQLSANATLSMLSSVSGSGKMSSSVSAMTTPALFWLSKHDVQREEITQEQ